MNCLQTQGMNIGFIHTGYIVDFVWIMDELIKLSDNLMCGYCKKFFKIKYTPSEKMDRQFLLFGEQFSVRMQLIKSL